MPSSATEGEKPLTPKQQRFVDRYLIDLNASKAYQAVYGGTTKAADAHGARAVANGRVASAIKVAMDKRAGRTEVTVDRVVQELAVVGFSNVWDYEIDENGHVTLAEGAAPSAIRAVSSIKRKRRVIPREDGDDIVEVETEIKLWDKPATLRLTGQHLGMYVEKHELKLPPGTGVLSVPTVPDVSAWVAATAAYQAQLAARHTNVAKPAPG